MVMSDWPIFWIMNVPADPAVDVADPITIPGKLTCSGVTERKGLALTTVPVRVMPCSVEYPLTPLVVNKVRAVVSTPGITDGALVLSLCRTNPVRLKVTGIEKESPVFKLPCGKLEF